MNENGHILIETNLDVGTGKIWLVYNHPEARIDITDIVENLVINHNLSEPYIALDIQYCPPYKYTHRLVTTYWEVEGNKIYIYDDDVIEGVKTILTHNTPIPAFEKEMIMIDSIDENEVNKAWEELMFGKT